MYPKRLTTVLGAAAVLGGAWWVWSTLAELIISMYSGKSTTEDYLFACIMGPLMALPGVYAVYCGVRLMRAPDARYLKRIVGCFALFIALGFSVGLNRVLALYVPERLQDLLGFFLATLLVLPLYVLAVVFLLRKTGHPVIGWQSVIGKGVIVILSLEIWGVSQQLIEAYAPIKAGYRHVPEDPWLLIEVFGPMLLAGTFFLIAGRWVMRREQFPKLPAE